MNRIFEPKAPIKVTDLMELNNLDDLLQGTFTMTTIQTEQRKEDGSFVAVSIKHLINNHIHLYLFVFSII